MTTQRKRQARTIYWHWQDLRKQKHGRLCTHGRAWLHTANNTFHVEWWRDLALGAKVHLADGATGADAMSLTLHLLVMTLHFSVQRAKWARVLPGVRWVSGKWGSGERELGATVGVGAETGIYLWIWPWSWPGGGYRGSILISLTDLLLGWHRYREEKELTYHTQISMPEGTYEARLRIYDAVWRRERWPVEHRVTRVDVAIEHGIPVPGKGENSWDQDDTAIYEFTVPASTISEAEERVRGYVMDRRRRYASEDWAPAGGWPKHCLRDGNW